MSLRDAMRKAAGLLIEMPPESSDDAQNAADDFVEPQLEAEIKEKPDIDKLLAEAGIKRTVPSGSTLSPAATKPATAPQTKSVAQVARDLPGPTLEEIKTQ